MFFRYFGKKREEDGHTHQWTVYLKPLLNEDMSTWIKKVCNLEWQRKSLLKSIVFFAFVLRNEHPCVSSGLIRSASSHNF